MGAYPQIADWNEDGLIDLLVGDTNGKISLFLNNGSVGNPQLTAKGFIKANNNDLNVINRASPVVVDWNNDGKKDLVVGDNNGYVRLYLNSGVNNDPKFTTFAYIKVNNVNIKVSYSASPEVCDLDGDGKKDMLVSDYSGYVYFYRNSGEDANPTFTAQEKLLAGTSYMKTISTYARIDVVDWDEDGDLDIIAGEDYAYVNLFLNTSNPSAIAEQPIEMPLEFSLSQNYPNPFNTSTTIFYQLPKPANVNLSIFNLSGQLVKALVNESKMVGYHLVNWDASGVSSGIYIIKLTTDQFSETKKCVLQK
ncbi:MAG: T9SS type A sorting domain-containing protein [bacterium]|nr:T9SS type A sorting domain-containing protein [bacterium]